MCVGVCDLLRNTETQRCVDTKVQTYILRAMLVYVAAFIAGACGRNMSDLSVQSTGSEMVQSPRSQRDKRCERRPSQCIYSESAGTTGSVGLLPGAPTSVSGLRAPGGSAFPGDRPDPGCAGTGPDNLSPRPRVGRRRRSRIRGATPKDAAAGHCDRVRKPTVSL